MSTVLSRKEQRKLKKSMNTKKVDRSPAKSNSSNSIGPPATSLHTLFKPPSPTQTQEHALIANALIHQAKIRTRTGKNATAGNNVFASSSSVVSDDSDASVKTTLHIGTNRHKLPHEPFFQCTLPGYFGDTPTTVFDPPVSESCAEFTEDEEDFHTAVESPTMASSPVPIVNPRTRPSAIPTARPSPDFGFALKRSNKVAVDPSVFDEHASQRDIGGRTRNTGKGDIWEDTTTVQNHARDWCRTRKDSAVSFIFPLSPQSKAEMNCNSTAESSSAIDTFDTDLDRFSTVRYNPVSGLRYAPDVPPVATVSATTTGTTKSPRPAELLPSPPMPDDMPMVAYPRQHLSGPVTASHENSRRPRAASILPFEEVDPSSKYIDDAAANMHNDQTFGHASRRDHGWLHNETGMLHAFFHRSSPYNDTTMALTRFGLRSMPVLWRAIAIRSVMWTDPPRQINGYPNLTHYWLDEVFEVISYEEKLASWLVKRQHDYTGHLGWVQKADFTKILPPAMNSMPCAGPQYAHNAFDSHGLMLESSELFSRRSTISDRAPGSDCAETPDYQEYERQSSANHIYHTVHHSPMRFLTEPFRPYLPQHSIEQVDGAVTIRHRAGSSASDRSFSSVSDAFPSPRLLQDYDNVSAPVSPANHVLTSVVDGRTTYQTVNADDASLYDDSAIATVTKPAMISRPANYNNDEGLYDEGPHGTATKAAISSPAVSAVSDPCSSPGVGRCFMPHDLEAHTREQHEKVIARLEAARTLDRQSRQDHFHTDTTETALPTRARSHRPLPGPASSILPSSSTRLSATEAVISSTVQSKTSQNICDLEMFMQMQSRVKELEEQLEEEQNTTETWRRCAVDFETEVHEFRKHDKEYKTHLKASLEARTERRRVQEEMRSASKFKTMRLNLGKHEKKIVDDYELRLQQERTKLADIETSWCQYIGGNVQSHREMMAEQDALHRAELQKMQERHHKQMVLERKETDATRQLLCAAKERQKQMADDYDVKLREQRFAAQKRLSRHENITDESYRNIITENEAAWRQRMAGQEALHQIELEELKEAHRRQLSSVESDHLEALLVADNGAVIHQMMADQKALHQAQLRELKDIHRQQILKGGPGHLEALLSDSMLETNLIHQLQKIYAPDESLRSASIQGMPRISADGEVSETSQPNHMTTAELKQAIRLGKQSALALSTEGPALGSSNQENSLLVEAVKRGIVVPPSLTAQHAEALASTSGEEAGSSTAIHFEASDWCIKLNEADKVRAIVRFEVETNLAKELAPAAEGTLSMQSIASAATVSEPAVISDSSTNQVATPCTKSALSLAIATTRDLAQRGVPQPGEPQPNETWREAYWSGMPAPVAGIVGDAGGDEHVEYHLESVELAAPANVPAPILSGRGQLLVDTVEATERAVVVDVSGTPSFTSSADDVDLYDSVEVGTVVDVPAALVDASGEESDSWVQVEHEVYESSVDDTEEEATSQAEDSSHYDGDDEVTTDAED